MTNCYHLTYITKNYIKIGNLAKNISIICPSFVWFDAQHPKRELTEDEILSEAILDQGTRTTIELAGTRKTFPGRQEGLADGTISAAGFGTASAQNFLTASNAFDYQAIWVRNNVAVAKSWDGDFPVFGLTQSGQGEHYLYRQNNISGLATAYLFAVWMAAPQPVMIKLWAKYDDAQAPEVAREYIVDSEARWYLLPIPANTYSADQIELRIYSGASVVGMVDSVLMEGTRFPGAIPNPDHSFAGFRPAGVFGSPRFWGLEYLHNFGPGASDHLKHFAQLGHAQPSGGVYKKGDIVWVSDPEVLGYAGLICVSVDPLLFMPFAPIPGLRINKERWWFEKGLESLGDSALGSAGYSSPEQTNYMLKSFDFSAQPPWEPENVTLTEVTVLGAKVWEMEIDDEEDPGWVEQVVDIPQWPTVWLFAAQMGSDSVSVPVEAQYLPDGDIFNAELLVGPEGNWYLFPIGMHTPLTNQLRVRIYAVAGHPIYLGDTFLAPGDRFPGAIPNPSDEAPRTRPALCLGAPWLFTQGLVWNTPGSAMPRHGYWHDDNTPPDPPDPPSPTGYNLGDVVYTDDPKDLGYIGWVLVLNDEEEPEWREFGPLAEA